MADNNQEVSAQDINAHCYAAQGYVVTDFEHKVPIGSLCDFGGGPMRVIAISNREEFMRQYPLMVEVAGEPMAYISLFSHTFTGSRRWINHSFS